MHPMFIKHFKPWAEVIRTRFVATIFKTSSFEHRGILQFVFTKRFAAKKVYVNCGHGVDKRSISCVEAVVVQLYDENMDCRSTPADISVN